MVAVLAYFDEQVTRTLQDTGSMQAWLTWGIHWGRIQGAGGRARICLLSLHLPPVSESLHLALLPILLCRPHHIPLFVTLGILQIPHQQTQAP